MKINKKHNPIIEWIIAIVLIMLCRNFSIFSYGSLSAIRAHEKSERTLHYGPSDIIRSIDLDDAKIYLCRYKDWFSISTVKRGLVMWYPGGGGVEVIDYSKQVSYSWGTSDIKENMITKIYGYVSDSDIDTIIITDENKTNKAKYVLDESRMFIFHWNDNEQKNKIQYLRGLNEDGNVIYEEDIVGF